MSIGTSLARGAGRGGKWGGYSGHTYTQSGREYTGWDAASVTRSLKDSFIGSKHIRPGVTGLAIGGAIGFGLNQVIDDKESNAWSVLKWGTSVAASALVAASIMRSNRYSVPGVYTRVEQTSANDLNIILGTGVFTKASFDLYAGVQEYNKAMDKNRSYAGKRQEPSNRNTGNSIHHHNKR